MTHPGVKPDNVHLYWNDELEPNFGKADLVETAEKPRFGKKGSRPNHNLEKTLPRFSEKSHEKYSEGTKPALVLDFAKTGENRFSTVVNGVFITVQKQENGKKWEARAEFRAWKTPVFEADDPASALTRLVNYQRWFCHRKSMEWWSLAKLYRKVHFVFPFGKRKRMPKAGTFVRDFSIKHVDGWLAWKPESSIVPAKKQAPVKNEVFLRSKPVIKQGASWPSMNDSKYQIVNGTLETRDSWKEPDIEGRI